MKGKMGDRRFYLYLTKKGFYFAEILHPETEGKHTK